MGYSTSWIAVKGVDQQQIADALGWTLSNTAPGGRLVHGVAALPDGWMVTIAPRDGALKAPLLDLARLGPSIACFIEEHVMYSEARGFDGGAEVWRVVHDAEKGLLNLEVTGSPPGPFAQIRDELVAQQAAEDEDGEEVDVVFDGPPRLSQALCGFRMDDPPDGIVFKSLQPAARAGLFARLFGRG